MKQQSLLENDTAPEIKGVLERVVFHNEENGYTILRIRPEGKDDLYTVVGKMHAPQPGSHMRVRGSWVNHPKFGRQMQMESYAEERPSSEEGIRLFLASGCIKGIGPRWAERIVEKFHTETLRVLDEDPERLLELPRFGAKRLKAVQASWAEHQGVRELMIFLQGHGVGPALAFRIYRFYEQAALSIVQENPYRLAMDIHGVGFLTADELAKKLGFSEDSPLRAEAGLLYTLVRMTDEGHIYYPRRELITKASESLNIEESLLEDALKVLLRDERIVIEDFGDHEGVYLSRNHMYESKIAFYLKRLTHSPRAVHFADARKTVEKVLSKMPITLAEEQREAVFTSTGAKVMVLTGGPGTGKTTILNAIIKVFQDVGAKILLAAPTGRAAKRMSETSGCEAKTIHRLLEYSPKEEGFGRNENNPLACSLLVVDESSMMDTMLMYFLIKAAPLGATIVFVGDINQLPSVGPGNVLRDIIASGSVPVVELVEVFRQAAESDIICNAHLINKGDMPQIRQGGKSDFYFFQESDPELAADLIVDLVQDKIPRRFGFKSDDIQVLSPMLRGSTGVNSLNQRLQDVLNQSEQIISKGNRQYKLGDKVMQIKNNYDKDVFNGDMGVILLMDMEERELTIRFDDRNVPYTWEELDEIIPAYAISIHKSQGGEYPVVVMPLLMQHYIMLQRNLVYTGVTRGRKLVIVVGEIKALAMAIKNNHIRKRYTWLAHRLAENDAQLRTDMLPERDFEAADVYSDDIPNFEDWQ